MENATYVGLSRQMAMHRKMDVIANNLANMNTTAYKREKVLFEEYLLGDTQKNERVSFVRDYAQIRNMGDGELSSTGNPMDVAISGPGFFTVETENGDRYTRNGHFRINDQGYLVIASGESLLDDQGQTIQVDLSEGELSITPDGTISSSQGVVARLQLVTFDNEQMLKKVGNGLYEGDDLDPRIGAEGQILQGMIESSNVEPIVEMTQMIDILRSYQSMQKMMDTGHDLQRKAIERLPRLR